MKNFKDMIFVTLLLLIVVCKGDDSLLNQLLTKVDALERKGNDFAAKQEVLEGKLKIYADLTEKLQEELKEKDHVIGDMKVQINGFEESIRELQTGGHDKKILSSKFRKNANSRIKEKAGSEHSRPQNESTQQNRQEFSTDPYILPRRQVLSPGENVAFHAVIKKSGIFHVGVNQNVVFETVMLNLNNAYHPLHGVFIAPTAGLYIFSTSILSYNGQKTALFAADLVKNGAMLSRAYGHGDSGYHDQGSVTVVTQLASGDEVWVRLSCCTDDSLFGTYYTSFTGALLNLV